MLKKIDSFVFIILPVFNGEKYILQQLMSIYYQTFKNWYLIIVNDGSTDATLNIIENFIKDYNLQWKIKILNKNNSWVNKAIETWLYEMQKLKEKFEWYDIFVSYCDADDVRMRNKLEYQLKYIIEKKADLCYHDLIVINENDGVIWDSYNKILRTPFNNIYDNSFLKFCLYNHITSTTMLFKYDYVKTILPMCNWLYQDWYTCLIISWLNWKIVSIETPLAYYRRHANAMTGPGNKKTSSDFFKESINVLINIKNRLTNQNEDVANLILKDYQFRVKHPKKQKLYHVSYIIKHYKILKYYIKSVISFYFR